MVENVGERIVRLRTELERQRDHCHKRARMNYQSMLALTGLVVASSALTSILALGFLVDHRFLGILALVPAIAVSIDSHFKLQAKSAWHYEKYDALRALLRQLNYGLPAKPTAEQVAEIGAAFSILDREMSEEWERILAGKPKRARNSQSTV